MAGLRRYVMNLGIAGVGAAGEIVECDPDLYAVWIEASPPLISEVDDDGARQPLHMMSHGWTLDDDWSPVLDAVMASPPLQAPRGPEEYVLTDTLAGDEV